MLSLHPFLVLTSPPPEALSRGPTGLSIRNVTVALKERFSVFTACTNQHCCRPCICLWRGCRLRCTSVNTKKKATSIPGSIGTGAQAVAVRPFSVSIPGRCAQCWIVYAKRGREMKFHLFLGLPPPFAIEQVCTVRRVIADYWQVVFPPPLLLKLCCSFQVCP